MTKPRQVLLVEARGASVSYDLYELCDDHRLVHGVIEGEQISAVLDRLQAQFGNRAVIAQRIEPAAGAHTIPVEISARHVHLDRETCDALFGVGYELEHCRAASQPGQYLARETVDLIGPRSELTRVAIIGPLRAETQIELARTDAVVLGIAAPLRDSGQLAGSPGLILRGPHTSVAVDHGAIIARRHVHMNPDEARRLGVRDHDVIQVQVTGERELVLEDVVVRVGPNYVLDLHVDTDEASAAGLDHHATVVFTGIDLRGD